jgi:hypothetical protein
MLSSYHVAPRKNKAQRAGHPPELSVALFNFPDRWGGSDVGFIGIDVQGLNVVRKGDVHGSAFPGKGEFLNETTINLPLAFRIRSFGPLVFAQ